MILAITLQKCTVFDEYASNVTHSFRLSNFADCLLQMIARMFVMHPLITRLLSDGCRQAVIAVGKE